MNPTSNINIVQEYILYMQRRAAQIQKFGRNDSIVIGTDKEIIVK